MEVPFRFNGNNSKRETTYSALRMDHESRTPRVLSLLSRVLERSIQKNEEEISKMKDTVVVTIFHGSRAPSLSIKKYLERIFKYSSCSPSCFVLAYIYMDQYLQRMKFCITSLNVHRLLITSVMVATKFIDDR